MPQSKNRRKSKNAQRRKMSHLNFGRPINSSKPVMRVSRENIDSYIADVSMGLPKYQVEANKEWAKMVKTLLKPGGTLILNI
jgi:hypothetical protein